MPRKRKLIAEETNPIQRRLMVICEMEKRMDALRKHCKLPRNNLEYLATHQTDGLVKHLSVRPVRPLQALSGTPYEIRLRGACRSENFEFEIVTRVLSTNIATFIKLDRRKQYTTQLPWTTVASHQINIVQPVDGCVVVRHGSSYTLDQPESLDMWLDNIVDYCKSVSDSAEAFVRYVLSDDTDLKNGFE